LDVPEGTTVDTLLELLGIPAAETQQTFVNRRHQEGDYVLQDRERAAIFPPIAGG
jgi:molybdopterin converting factor small subunit